MPTPRSSSAAYASIDDWSARHDIRTLCQLASDTDAKLTPSQLQSSVRALAALADASGMVESAAGVGGAYSPDDLQALTGVALAYLKRLVCSLAMGYLFLGRPDRKGELPTSYVWAEEELEKIRGGSRVFGLAEQQDAGGAAEVDVETPQSVERRGGTIIEAQRFFGTRVNRLGPWGQ